MATAMGITATAAIAAKSRYAYPTYHEGFRFIRRPFLKMFSSPVLKASRPSRHDMAGWARRQLWVFKQIAKLRS